MRYVIDSSVAFKWVVPEPYSDKARQLRADIERPCLTNEEALANAPLSGAGCYKVPLVIER